MASAFGLNYALREIRREFGFDDLTEPALIIARPRRSSRPRLRVMSIETAMFSRIVIITRSTDAVRLKLFKENSITIFRDSEKGLIADSHVCRFVTFPFAEVHFDRFP